MRDEDILVVIPARGGSKGIPRKNLRWLAGRPLIGYSIVAARQVSPNVVVSTDDEEIAYVSSRLGAEIVERPKELAGDDVPLDPVIIHAWREYRRRVGTGFSWVVTVQPTSPLLSSETIRSVISKAREGGFDCWLTVSDARHLYWRQSHGAVQPLHPERVNRQWLPPLWKETGAVVVSSPVLLEEGIRVGGRVGLFPIPPDEDVDIDSVDDWAVAEYRLRAPRVAVRTIGNRAVGLGHAYRALALASRLCVPVFDFYVDSDSGLGAQLIRRFNYEPTIVSSERDFVEYVRKRQYTLVINDVLDTTTEYIRALRGKDERVVINFEDLGPGAAEASLTINELYEYSTPAPNQRFGWRYVCLRDEFAWGPKYEFRATPTTLLITFGGTDPSGLTARAMSAAAKALAAYKPRLLVVIGIGNDRIKEIATLVDDNASAFSSTDILRDVRRMSVIMSQADVAVTSNGRTVFELAATRVPMITVSQNVRESSHTFGRLSGGGVDLGLESGVSVDHLASVISQIWSDTDARLRMHLSLARYDLTLGVERVLRSITDTYNWWMENQHIQQGGAWTC